MHLEPRYRLPVVAIIEQPLPTDCLLGRGRAIEQHEGNKLFRSLVMEFLTVYSERERRRDNAKYVIREVVSFLQEKVGMRFLSLLDDRAHWKVASQERVRRKVGQHLRYHASRSASSNNMKFREREEEEAGDDDDDDDGDDDDDDEEADSEEMDSDKKEQEEKTKEDEVKKIPAAKQTMQAPISVIEEPLPTDCLFGRGKAIEEHEGNRQFRNVMQQFLPVYQEAQRRPETQQVISAIMSYLQKAGMRFLSPLDNDLGFWKLASQGVVRRKVGLHMQYLKRMTALSKTDDVHYCEEMDGRKEVKEKNKDDVGRINPPQAKIQPQIYMILPTDCILGCGKAIDNHEGNRQFRTLTRTFLPEYRKAQGPSGARRVISKATSYLQEKVGMRFFTRVSDKHLSHGQLASQALVRKKVGQQLRYQARREAAFINEQVGLWREEDECYHGCEEIVWREEESDDVSQESKENTIDVQIAKMQSSSGDNEQAECFFLGRREAVENYEEHFCWQANKFSNGQFCDVETQDETDELAKRNEEDHDKEIHVLEQKMQPPIRVIQQPLSTDCLVGRGRTIEHHEGNIRFRDLIREFVPEYLEARRCGDSRSNNTQRVISKVTSLLQDNLGMRFLTRVVLDKDLCCWKLASQEIVRKKVGQQLRYQTMILESTPRSGQPVERERRRIKDDGEEWDHNVAYMDDKEK